MIQNIINGVYTYEITKTQKISDNRQISSLRICKLEGKMSDDEFLVTDELGNVCFFDFENEGQIQIKTKKCCLVYTLGENIQRFTLSETSNKFGTFILLNSKRYEIVEILDNSVQKSGHLEIIEQRLNNFINEKEVFPINTLKFIDGKMSYEHTPIFEFSSYREKEVTKTSELFRSFLETRKMTNLPQLSRFMMITETEMAHYCYCFAKNDTNLTLVSFSADFQNSFSLFFHIFSSIQTNTVKDHSYLLSVPLLSPCNVRLKLKDKPLSISTVKRPPKIEYNFNFVIKMLTCIINERQMLFYSEKSSQIYDTLIFFQNIIKPFRYKYFISSCLPEKLSHILNSPFPFLIGTTNREIRYSNPEILFVDLDKHEVYNFGADHLPFEKEIRKKFKERSKNDVNENYQTIFTEYFQILKNNIDITRENYLIENMSDPERIKDLILRPENIRSMIKNLNSKFVNSFVQTRIFKDYISNPQRSVLLDYTVNVESKSTRKFTIKFRNSKLVKNNLSVYSIFFHFISDFELIAHLENNFFSDELLFKTSADLFQRLSQMENFDYISKILIKSKKLERSLKPEMFANICYFKPEKKEMREIIDLRGWTIRVFHICKCCGVFTSDESLKTTLKNKKMKMNMSKNLCKSTYDAILVQENYKEPTVYEIYDPEDIFLYIKRKSLSELKNLENYLFWNVITYFLFYNLPFNYVEPIDEAVDIVIEETSANRQINLLNLPSLQFER